MARSHDIRHRFDFECDTPDCKSHLILEDEFNKKSCANNEARSRGWVVGMKNDWCQSCGRERWLTKTGKAPAAVHVPCKPCFGRGHTLGVTCDVCDGRGIVPEGDSDLSLMEKALLLGREKTPPSPWKERLKQ